MKETEITAIHTNLSIHTHTHTHRHILYTLNYTHNHFWGKYFHTHMRVYIAINTPQRMHTLTDTYRLILLHTDKHT